MFSGGTIILDFILVSGHIYFLFCPYASLSPRVGVVG